MLPWRSRVNLASGEVGEASQLRLFRACFGIFAIPPELLTYRCGAANRRFGPKPGITSFNSIDYDDRLIVHPYFDWGSAWWSSALLGGRHWKSGMTFKVQVGPPQIAIHQAETVLVTEPDGQVKWPTERGLYFRDTRVISAWTTMLTASSGTC